MVIMGFPFFWIQGGTWVVSWISSHLLSFFSMPGTSQVLCLDTGRTFLSTDLACSPAAKGTANRRGDGWLKGSCIPRKPTSAWVMVTHESYHPEASWNLEAAQQAQGSPATAQPVHESPPLNNYNLGVRSHGCCKFQFSGTFMGLFTQSPEPSSSRQMRQFHFRGNDCTAVGQHESFTSWYKNFKSYLQI